MGTLLWLTLNVQPHCGAPSKGVVVCPLCVSAFGSLCKQAGIQPSTVDSKPI